MNIKSYHVTLLEEKTLFTTDVFLVSAATERLLNPDFGPFLKVQLLNVEFLLWVTNVRVEVESFFLENDLNR